jgi:hypothetical protein
VFTHGGRLLRDGALLAAYTLRAGSTVHVAARLLGGGGDGGSTGAESRSCYLEMYQGKKPDKVNPAEELLARYGWCYGQRRIRCCAHYFGQLFRLFRDFLFILHGMHARVYPSPRWTRCHLSGEDLQPPCVIDELGSVYNKDAVVRALLTKTLPGALCYITGLKSLTELQLTRKSQRDDAAASQPKAAVKGMHNPGNASRFICPVSGQEFNGRHVHVQLMVLHTQPGLVRLGCACQGLGGMTPSPNALGLRLGSSAIHCVVAVCRFRFLVHRPSGTCLSEKAVKEVPAVVSELLGGVKPAADDWLPVNPTGEWECNA